MLAWRNIEQSACYKVLCPVYTCVSAAWCLHLDLLIKAPARVQQQGMLVRVECTSTACQAAMVANVLLGALYACTVCDDGGGEIASRYRTCMMMQQYAPNAYNLMCMLHRCGSACVVYMARCPDGQGTVKVGIPGVGVVSWSVAWFGPGCMQSIATCTDAAQLSQDKYMHCSE